MRYCSECGSAVEDNVQVCPSCGCQIKDEGLNNGMYMNSYSAMPEKKKTNKALVIVLPILIIALLVGGLAAYKFVYIPKMEEQETLFDGGCMIASGAMLEFVGSVVNYRSGDGYLMSEDEANETKKIVDEVYGDIEDHPKSCEEKYNLIQELYDAYEDVMYYTYDYQGYQWDVEDKVDNAAHDFLELFTETKTVFDY